MERILLITNADAGSNESDPLDAALAVLSGQADLEVAQTADTPDLDGVLARRADRRVVVAGGDGSLHALLAALYRRGELSEAVVGLIPLGTGNDFARSVGVPLDPGDAARLSLHGEVRAVDLLEDQVGTIIVNAVHVGVGAEAGREAKGWKSRIGKPGYVVGAVIAGLKTQGLRLRVEADQEVVTDLDRLVLQVGVGNGRTVGGGTELLPDADPEDGLLDVVVSFATAPLRRLSYAARLKQGTHPRLRDVRYLRAREVSVTGQDFWCNADGELEGPDRHRAWRVVPGAARMVLPPRRS